MEPAARDAGARFVAGADAVEGARKGEEVALAAEAAVAATDTGAVVAAEALETEAEERGADASDAEAAPTVEDRVVVACTLPGNDENFGNGNSIDSISINSLP